MYIPHSGPLYGKFVYYDYIHQKSGGKNDLSRRTPGPEDSFHLISNHKSWSSVDKVVFSGLFTWRYEKFTFTTLSQSSVTMTVSSHRDRRTFPWRYVLYPVPKMSFVSPLLVRSHFCDKPVSTLILQVSYPKLQSGWIQVWGRDNKLLVK